MNRRRWMIGAGLAAFGAAGAGIAALRTVGAARSQDLGAKLTDDPSLPVLGNPLGRIAAVEFFDYRCPYCRTMQPVLQETLARHRDVRLVLREWPIFGGVSVYAAKVALASNWQGRFAPVHAALFALGRGMDEASVRGAAAASGVDMARLDADMRARSQELDTALGDTTILAHSLGFQGTPGFIVGRFKAAGALTSGDLDRMIARSAQPS